jgi:putative addiction module component
MAFQKHAVPVKALFENLESGAMVDQFLEWFPGVTTTSARRAWNSSRKLTTDGSHRSRNCRNRLGRVPLVHAVVLPLQKMSRDEKLRAMEALWVDLSRDENRFDSPTWHEQALRGAERAVKTEKARFSDWEQAKKRIRRKAANLGWRFESSAWPKPICWTAFGFTSGKPSVLVRIFSNPSIPTLSRFDFMPARIDRLRLSSNALETISVRHLWWFAQGRN